MEGEEHRSGEARSGLHATDMASTLLLELKGEVEDLCCHVLAAPCAIHWKAPRPAKGGLHAHHPCLPS